MAGSIKFGTDGWRAVIAEGFTFPNVRACAQGVAQYVRDEGLADRGLIIGYDTRFLSDRFAEAVAEVVAANGVKNCLGSLPAPTPVVSYGIVARKAAGAVVITASHNPPYWNGFKFKPDYAGSATPEITAALEANIDVALRSEGVLTMPVEDAVARGLVEYVDLKVAYRRQIARLVDLDRLRGAGITVAVDSMYGAGAGYLKSFLSGGATSVREIHRARNPLFPGFAQPEPIGRNLAPFSRFIKRAKADVGLATDGDADRVGVADETGRILTPLQIYGLLAYYLLEVRGERGALVKSITTTRMIDRLGERYGVAVLETPVGFKYIGPLMMEHNALVGGEESGGFGFRGHIPERDGILSSLYILDLMATTRRSVSQLLSDLYALVGPHHYNRVDIHISQELKGPVVQRISADPPSVIDGRAVASFDRTDGLRFILEDGSWLLLRLSGTEPLMRIYAESDGLEKVDRLLAEGRRLTGT